MSETTCLKLPHKFRVVKLTVGWDMAAEAGGGSYSITNTYAIPDDGRDLMDMTIEELRAWPAASALAMLDDIVSGRAPTGKGADDGNAG